MFNSFVKRQPGVSLQTVPVAQVHSSSQQLPQQAVFALDEPSARLYAAGGAAPSTVHSWDMSQERCTQQVHSLKLPQQQATAYNAKHSLLKAQATAPFEVNLLYLRVVLRTFCMHRILYLDVFFQCGYAAT